MSLLKLLRNQLKPFELKQKSAGFTLIELLVAMILAALVITPLLGFMINIMETEQREQAKANTEQELKSALDFIARDLEQAVYIYDNDGITAINSQLPQSINSTHSPILVFWKRQYIKDIIPINNSNCVSAPENCDDTFTYSLVAYYLIKDNDSIWSKAARIGRFQISDGYGENRNTNKDAGFQLFDLKGRGELKTKMNAWKKDGDYTQKILPLIDYVDQTTGLTTPNCPATMQAIARGFYGFYSCVDSANTTAEIHLRGNALARIKATAPAYTDPSKNYFPQASVRVKGRGFLFTQ